MGPSSEAVEAAELAMQFWKSEPGRAPDDQKPTWWDLAEAALAAALPFIRREERAKVAAQIEALVVNLDRMDPYTEAVADAARIARGAS
jgi:hypothetical protein